MKRTLLTILILLLASPAFAKVTVTVKKEYYSIPGRGKAQISQEMQRRAPYRMGNKYVPAYMKPNLRFKYSLKKKNGRCSTDNVQVYLIVMYKYPRLAQHQSSSKVRFWWKDIMKHYTIHEEIHGSIAIRWAHAIDRELRGLTDMNCDTAKQTIADRANYMVRLMNEEQEEYDRITKHGMQQHKYHGPK